MLLHSRNLAGQKELTDMNALADEYLKLSYHGMRAKDKSFNVVMQTDFDPAIGKISIVPQDISRVMLNLYNNAFYAVSQKMKEQIPGYTPTVSVTTERNGDHITIVVSDNGTGVPNKIMDKIFQPFFSTKPTGQGTGLGLSMSYDIIKAHGGDLKVESREGAFTRFIIQIPVV
jgi:signal transduction histidine kinase